MKKWYVIVVAILAFIMITSSGAVAIGVTLTSGNVGTSSSTTPSTSGSSSAGSTNVNMEGSSASPNHEPNPDPPPNQPPAAEIVSIDPSPAFNDSLVNFVGKGCDPENCTKYFSWDFNGDGAWEIEDYPVDGNGWRYHYVNYTYSSPGFYTVVLRVKDVMDDYDIDAKQGIIVYITLDIDNTYIGFPTYFTANVECVGYTPTNYYWVYGDGTVNDTTEYHTEHIYTLGGTYTGNVTVSSPDQGIDGIKYDFSVNISQYISDNHNPISYFNMTKIEAPGNRTYFFDGSGSYDNDAGDNITYYQWFFNDGLPSYKSKSPTVTRMLNWQGGDYCIILRVKDNGTPPLFGYYYTDISIPGDIPDLISDNNVNVNSFDVTETSSQSVYSVSSSYVGYSESQASSYRRILSVFGSSSLFLKILTVIRGGTGATCYGGICDLKFSSVTYTPSPPKRSEGIRFDFTVIDELGTNYTDSYIDIHVVSDIPLDFPFNVDIVNGTAVGNFTIMWPDNTKSYYITLTAIPKEDEGWTEIDWSDNSYTIDGLHAKALGLSVSTGYSSTPGQSSSQGSYIVGSSNSVGIGSTAVQYGSYNL